MGSDDPHKLIGRTFYSAPLGRVESRGQSAASPANRQATGDAQRLADALSDYDETTDATVAQAGRELGWPAARTLAAIRSAARLGLLDDWHE